MTDDRVQTWRERLPIIAKMVDSAFNGDTASNADAIRFVLIAVSPEDDIALVKNMTDHHAVISFLEVIAHMEDRPPDAAGHA